MKCYALAVKFEESAPGSFNWFVPSEGYSPVSFFASQVIKRRKTEILDFCQRIETDGEIIFTKKDGIYLYAKKLKENYCLFALEKEASEKEINYLTYHLIVKRIDIAEVAQHIEKYSTDYRVISIKKDLHETKKIMLENIEKTIKRGEQMEELLEKTEILSQSCMKFKEEAEELNSCWPRWCILY